MSNWNNAIYNNRKNVKFFGINLTKMCKNKSSTLKPRKC